MSVLSLILDVVIPDTCVLCLQTLTVREPHLLCPFCWASLPRVTHACVSCSLPLPAPGLCGRCVRHPLVNGRTVAALKHIEDARTLIHQLKYSKGLRAGRTLSQLMLEVVHHQYQHDQLPECLIPVPLSWRNQLRRGYNQATWLAQPLSRSLVRPILHTHIRRRHGPAQHTLSQKARWASQNKTFALHKPLKHRHVAIVDDVLTTGGTVKALSNLLVKAGVARVDVWCASRAVL